MAAEASPKLKILLFDIETMATLGYVWGRYEQDVISEEKEWYMLCYCAKWLDKKQVIRKGLPDFSLYKRDKENDRELVKSLWQLFDEADIIIAHNGNSFDIKKSNAKFIEHGLLPPSLYKTIDTKLVAKSNFKFDSNKLDDLGIYLGLGRKLHTGGFELWKSCARGDMKAWKKMLDYNAQDVILLEKVYLKMQGWVKNPPDRRVLHRKMNSCPSCNSNNTSKRGFHLTITVKKQRNQCMLCGHWFLTKL